MRKRTEQRIAELEGAPQYGHLGGPCGPLVVELDDETLMLQREVAAQRLHRYKSAMREELRVLEAQRLRELEG